MTIIGVHTPEGDFEHDINTVREKVRENGFTFPVVVDNDRRIWNAWGNNYWPSIYLVDKKGFVRYRWDGELGWGSTNGDAIMRQKIAQLLAEKG